MYQNYIQKSDITARFNDVNLDELTGANDNIWLSVEKSTLELIAGHTRHWYDMDKEFRPISAHVEANEYASGDRVIDNSILYVAIQDVTPGITISDTSYWEVKDDRNQVLVMIAVDMMLYDLIGRNNSRNAPAYRFDRNKDAKDDLMKIKKGHIQLDIPTKVFESEEEEEEDLGQAVNFGIMDVRLRHDY